MVYYHLRNDSMRSDRGFLQADRVHLNLRRFYVISQKPRGVGGGFWGIHLVPDWFAARELTGYQVGGRLKSQSK
jgi:hypothetical protein